MQRNLQDVLRSYLTRVITDDRASHQGEHRALHHVPPKNQMTMKVLILDEETMRCVSTVMSQREMLRLGVYLIEMIDRRGPSMTLPVGQDSAFSSEESYLMSHMSAVYFVRPTKDAIARIRKELREPRFGRYSLYFSNVMSDMRLQDVAESDVKELVYDVREAFGDYIAVDAHHFCVPLAHSYMSFAPPHVDFSASSDMVDRITEGVASVLLSLRSKFQIRFQKSSDLANRVASSLNQLTQHDQRELFDFGSRDSQHPVVLLLDRKQDPVTPLLSQWTYQAMIHEILGIQDNIVHIQDGGTPRHSQQAGATDFVVSSLHDEFFSKNMYSNFGDMGMAVKNLVDQVSADHKTVRDFDSIDDIAEFVEHLPEATQQQGLTGKHVSIMSALSREVESRSLMALSGVEQDVCCQASNPTSHYEAVSSIVHDPSITAFDKARLVLLFALRYDDEAPQQTSSLFGALESTRGIDPIMLDTVRYVRKCWSTQAKDLDLFSDKTLSSRFVSLAKQHLRGVENVYTQHRPAFVPILEKLAKGRLPTTDYPFIQQVDAAQSQRGTKLVVVFIIGGSTYEEAKAIAEMNSGSSEHSVPGVQIILGSTGIHNSKSFLEDLGQVWRLEMYKNYR